MREKFKEIPDGRIGEKGICRFRWVIDKPLCIDMKVRKQDTELYFDMSGSSPPCLGPMNGF
ncbi:MAG: hypothetical protein CM1200mP30_07800 [Pseudomonadota bacterium]|nr:MAG: hypothetical protein CM1200mP30_07800 [Pseudomonadota bacterium]